MTIIQKRRVTAIVVAVLLVLTQMVPVISNADTSNFVIKDGTLVKYNGEEKNVEIPSDKGIRDIGKDAFKGNKAIVSVVVPAGVQTIGESAFESCEKLVRVELNAGLQTIGTAAFKKCKVLKYVELPEGLTDIGANAFYGTETQFAKMPSTLKTIGKMAYYNSKVVAVSLNEGLESVGDSAFETCYKLFGLEIPSSVAVVGKSVAGDNDSPFKWLLFKNDQTIIPSTPTDLMTITYYGGAESTIQKIYQAEFDKAQAKNQTTKLQFADKDTFKHVSGISVPNANLSLEAGTTQSIGATAEPTDATDTRLGYLSKKDNVVSVNYKGEIKGLKVGEAEILVFSADGIVTSVNVEVTGPQGKEFEISASGALVAYYGHDSEITIPDEVTSISAGAFEDDKHISKVVMGRNVTSIANNAFNNCELLGEVDLSNASALKSIGKSVFGNCKKLTKIVVPANVETIDEQAFSGCSSLQTVTFEQGSKVSKLSKSIFSACPNLESVNIPDSCTVIDERAFASDVKLKNIQFNSNLTKIGKQAFYSNRELKTLTIPEGVTTIGQEAFWGMSNLESISLPATLNKIDGTTIFAFIFDNKDTVNSGNLKKIEIAEANQKYKSANGMVYEGDKLVYIPQGIEHAVAADGTTVIGKFAASVHANLKTVVIPTGVTKIEESAFINCDAIESVKLPETLEEIGNAAFLGCEECTDLVIPKSVKKISGLALYELESLRQIVIPDGVTKIEQHGVAGNDNMQHLILSRNLVEVANNGCSFYPNAEELYLPDKLEKIGVQGFGAFSKVQYLELPASLKTIGAEAFKLMHSLKSVYIHGGVNVPNDMFLDTKSDKVYIFSHEPNESIKAIVKTPQYELIDLAYEKDVRRKVELQGFENLLNKDNHDKTFSVNIKEENAKEKEAIRLNVAAKEGEKEIARPNAGMKLVVELTPEQENKNYYTAMEKDGKYTAVQSRRVDRFVVVELQNFGNVVLSESRLAPAQSFGKSSHKSSETVAPPVKQEDQNKPAVTVKNEAAKELVKNITDQKQADNVDKLVANIPMAEKKEALKVLTTDTKAKMAAAVLPKYGDVKTNAWYSNDLAVVMSMGLVKGTSANAVSPAKNVTGKEMMTMLVRSMGKEVTPKQGANWYDAYKNEAAALKLDEGIQFDVSKDLTRAEVSAMMFRYIKLNEKEAVKVDTSALVKVADTSSIPAEYKEAVAYMYQKGILKGYEDGSFAPNKTVSRIEVISLLSRLLTM